MREPFRAGFLRPLLLLVLTLLGSWPAAAAEYTGTQTTGALYRIVVPDAGWNGRLVTYAHGYVFPLPGAPLDFHDTLPDGTSVADAVTSLGYAYAVTSYRQNGLTVLEGVDDLKDLVHVVFPSVVGTAPAAVYVVGASHGGLVTTLSIEQHPWLYAGGVAVCGPIGSFPGQVDYFGNARVLFDYYFPGVIPGSPIDIPPYVFSNWATTYAPMVAAAIAARPARAAEAARVAGLAVDSGSPATLVDSWIDVLTNNVYATNDAVSKLGGNPFDNTRKLYLGSSNDWLLNWRVQRFAAHPAARGALQDYQTSGLLASPLVTMHTTLDPVVPYWHEVSYRSKTIRTGSWVHHINLPVFQYGHCAFTREELLFGFALVRLQVEGLP